MEKSKLKIQIKDEISGEFKTIVDCFDIPGTKKFNNSNGEVNSNYNGVDINIDIPKTTK